jgi:putative flavoprotein involved in K+ transport
VIGGGQAGLATSYHATQRDIEHVVLDAGAQVGAAWRHRYDSLRLFTPRRYSRLPGMHLPGDPDGYPSRDEVADYLSEYASRFALPVHLGARVGAVTRGGDCFVVSTKSTTYRAATVVVATGPFQEPWTPTWASGLDGVFQLHSAVYRNPSQVRGRRVLIVGGGNSGAQIAEELTASGLDVSWSVSAEPRFMPQRVLGRDIFWWLDRLGVLEADTESLPARLLRRRGDPVFGTGPRTMIRAGRLKTAPEALGASGHEVSFVDGSSITVDTVVWCTGFRADRRWLGIPDALDELGTPVHDQGVSTAVHGLGYVGLGWQRSRNSALLGGVGADAAHVLDRLLGLRPGIAMMHDGELRYAAPSK